ncbi:MAG: hypothetical protein JNL05_10595 [Flavobacteriales bacterium]|nr:hypothetical protein [Flavobacteriales bacterium]
MLGDDGDLVIRNGDFAVADATTDDVALLLLTSKGEHMLDAFVGCDMPRRMNGVISRSQLQRIVRLQAERDGINWDAVRDGINIIGRG